MRDIPVVMVLFGGTGDLAHRKLYPALFNLYEQKLIRHHFAVIGTARSEWSNQHLREQIIVSIRDAKISAPASEVKNFVSHFYYQAHDVTVVDHYVTLKNLASKLDQKYATKGNRIFYLAMAPRFFGIIASHINDQKLTGTGFNRIVVEKPFGRSLATAEKLNKQITASFAEKDIFRIDHYLGKEMVQNILPLRVANPLIANVWSGKYIDNIQVTLAEHLGVEARGSYYETSGALRDMVQNHIFQIVTLLAMPIPRELTPSLIHACKRQLLSSLIIPNAKMVAEHFVRGQYLGSYETFSYRQEPNVSLHSLTETYAAGQIKFGAGPLKGVPFYFRTGKKMREKASRVDIVLQNQQSLYGAGAANVISIIIDPRSEIDFLINGKNIRENGLRPERASYRFSESENDQVPDGYERLLHDIFVNDSTNFTHWNELKKFWQFIDAVENAWLDSNTKGEAKLLQYPPYRMGPSDADGIFNKRGEYWVYE